MVKQTAQLIVATCSKPEILFRGVARLKQAILSEFPSSLSELLTTMDELKVARANSSAEKSVVERISERARSSPGDIAVRSGGGELTYEELEDRAAHLGRILAGLGIEREGRVGVLLDRSEGLVVALLGIWKAGGAYVPLDPGFPVDRLRYMVEDSGVSVVVTQSGLSDVLGTERGFEVVELDRIQWEAADREVVGVNPKPNHLAYLIYTSGSTGKPKGVMVEHGSLATFSEALADCMGLDSNETFLAITTLAFDISLVELIVPLTLGGTTVVVDRETVSDPALLEDEISRSKPTIIQATPATWRMLQMNGWSAATNKARLISGGELLPSDLADYLLRQGRELWNLYGPTEATVWITAAKIQHIAEGVTIGKPLPRSTAYVVDADGQICPPNLIGELVLGGPQLARGYHNREALTDEKFVRFAFTEERLYRTGDLASWDDNGNLKVHGRTDAQVKVRGFRIELEEIETILRQHPDVLDAAADVTPGGESEIIAFVVPRYETIPDDIKSFVRRMLPHYMTPSRVYALDRLPRTENNKLNRRAVRRLIPSRNDEPRPVTAVNSLEGLIGEIWRKSLCVDEVGRMDDFFQLGGHSLLAMRAAATLSKAIGQQVSVRHIFMNPTPAELADMIQRGDISEFGRAEAK